VFKILKNVFINNMLVKLLALILALFTWSYIGGQLYRESIKKDQKTAPIIEVSGEKLIVKTLPIYVNIKGEPANRYRVTLDRITVNPSHSVVVGSKESLEGLKHIPTKPISITNAKSTVRKDLYLASIPGCKIGYEGKVRVVVPVARSRHR